jgi:uncharacterized membrane protein YfcA
MIHTAVVFFAVFSLGALLGGIGGLFGIGGGIIAIPVLALTFGMSQSLAQGTALVMMMPNVVIAFWRYYQRNSFPLRSALLIAAASVIATYPAARLAVVMKPSILNGCFSVFLFWLALNTLMGTRAAKANAGGVSITIDDRYLPTVGVVGGAFAGLFSVGAGIVATPILVRFFGKKQAVAQGLALALVIPGAVVALGTYAEAHQVNWLIGLPLAAGGITTVSYGVAWAHRLPEVQLRRLFGFLLLLTAVLMIRKSFTF